MPFFDQPSFFYRRWTSDEPSSVVLILHGFSEHSGLLHRLAAELTRCGSEVWALDHVGHGLSGAGDRMFESVDQLAANADALLSRILTERTSTPVFLLGHSLGGLTAVALAAERAADLAGLVLSGPPIVGLPEPVPENMIFSLEPSYLDELQHDALGPASPESVANLWRAVGDFLPRMAEMVDRLETPTLVIFGEHDVFTNPEAARRWSGSLPQARLWVVPQAYHDVLQDLSHRRVAAEICGFIHDHRLGGG